MPRKWEGREARGAYLPLSTAPPGRNRGDESSKDQSKGAPPGPIREGRGRARTGSSFAARFGRVILQDGIAAIPSALYHYQGRMKLKIQHVWFTSYVLSHKWDEDLPYPSLKKMSRAANIDLRYLQRIRSELCGAGYLEVGTRQSEGQGQETNTYDFSGLFERLEALIVGDPPLANPVQEDLPMPDLAELAELDTSFVARFGRIIVRRGVSAVPRAVFTHQGALGLTLQQVWFITYIFSFQWDASLPYPSLEKMADRTGYSRTHLHEIKAELVCKGYLRLIPRTNALGGRDTNAYDFSGLLDAIRSELQPAPPTARRTKPEKSTTGAGKQNSEIPDLRRSRRTITDAHNAVAPRAVMSPRGKNGGGPERTWGGGRKDTGGGGQGRTGGGGEKRIEESGRESTWRGGPRKSGADGRRSTASIDHGPLQGTVHRLHKEEEGNEETEIDDSNHVSPSGKKSASISEARSDPRPPYSAYIAQVATDFSNELQDSEHIVSNVTQALRLWEMSNLDEQEFVQLMYEAKTVTRKYQTRPHWDALANKMSYYYTVLRNLVGHRDGGRSGS